MKNKKIIDFIKFKSQYLYFISEIIDNAFFVKKEFNNVCFINNGFFSKQAIKLMSKNFKKYEIINIQNLETLKKENYDLIIAPYILQFCSNTEKSIKLLEKSLKANGVLMTNSFNILSASESINYLKEFMLQNKLYAQLIDFFELGKKLNNFQFQEKTLDREKLIILNNTIELINVFCVKKDSQSTTNSIKIVID